MSGRAAQDSYMDDSEEETCPLCVEEFDLSDKAFKPCPCGYQVCQFCVNNIRQNMNGLCPACRRPYDDKTIEIKEVNPEEYKADLRKKERVKAERRKEEAQKREPDPKQQGRRHLAGIRVVQQKLVYVTGLSPNIKEEALHKTLIGDSFFGQYGKIVRLIVKKQPSRDGGSHYGIYVTYDTEEEATKCIFAVNGSQNGERTLRAQHGTTKYCSTYIRGDECTNRSCTFLHEESMEGSESFTREGLSKLNAIGTQGSSVPSICNAAPPQPRGVTQSSASQSPQVQVRQIPSSEAPTLPSTANWASKQIQPQILRRGSQTTSQASISPAMAPASLAPGQTPEMPREIQAVASSSKPPSGSPLAQHIHTAAAASPMAPGPPAKATEQKAKPPHLKNKSASDTRQILTQLIKDVTSPDFCFVLNENALSEEAKQWAKIMPPLIDPEGGAKLRAQRERNKAELLRMEEARSARMQNHHAQMAEKIIDEGDEGPRSGSQQLGGEPDLASGLQSSVQQTIQPPRGRSIAGIVDREAGIESRVDHFANLNVSNRTPILQRPGSSNRPSDIHPPGLARGPAIKAPMTGLMTNENTSGRAAGQFGFGSEGGSRSAGLSTQKGHTSAFPGSSQGHFSGSAVSGPPPGLKSAGTPPVSGGGMFAQGHGFTNAGMGHSNPSKDKTNDYSSENYRSRGRNGGAEAGGKQAPGQPSLPSSEAEETVDPASPPAATDDPTRPSDAPKPDTTGDAPFMSPGQPTRAEPKQDPSIHTRTASAIENSDLVSKINSIKTEFNTGAIRTNANSRRGAKSTKSSASEEHRVRGSKQPSESTVSSKSVKRGSTDKRDGPAEVSRTKQSAASQSIEVLPISGKDASVSATTASPERAALPTKLAVKTLRLVPSKSATTPDSSSLLSAAKLGSAALMENTTPVTAASANSTASAASHIPAANKEGVASVSTPDSGVARPKSSDGRVSRASDPRAIRAATDASNSAETSQSRAGSVTNTSSSTPSIVRAGRLPTVDNRATPSETSRVRSELTESDQLEPTSPRDAEGPNGRRAQAVTQPEHAPVLGRKRKTKKVKSNPNSTLVSRATSPSPSSAAPVEDKLEDEVTERLASKSRDTSGSKGKMPSISATPVTLAEDEEPVMDSPPTREDVFQLTLLRMITSGHLMKEQLAKFFIAPGDTSSYSKKSIFDQDTYLKVQEQTLTAEERSEMSRDKKPMYKEIHNRQPTMFLPATRPDIAPPHKMAFLTKEEQERYAVLYERVCKSYEDSTAWIPDHSPASSSASIAGASANAGTSSATHVRAAENAGTRRLINERLAKIPNMHDILATAENQLYATDYPNRHTDDAVKASRRAIAELGAAAEGLAAELAPNLSMKTPRFLQEMHKQMAISEGIRKATGWVGGRRFEDLSMEDQDAEMKRVAEKRDECRREEAKSFKELERVMKRNRRLIAEVLGKSS